MELTPQQDRQSEIEALLLRLSSGDESAMEPLYTAIRPGVYAYALSLTRSIQDAEDVLHDAFLRICEAAGRYRPTGRPLPWVLTIARNLALSRLRE
ncbi:MAG TPA: RNA polymerase sigma factor, partial [Candidatus Aphodomorpha intestinavium]|nr:RNA polymerase sigma factor [Candidatus Aphodomorpha intestinavium]